MTAQSKTPNQPPETVFKGTRFNLVQKGHWQWIEHPGAVVILPFLENDKIVMIRNFRVAINQELWELPAGTLEKNEAPLHTAHRELEEETGYVAKIMDPLPHFYTSPGINNEIMFPFIARDLTATAQHLDEGEQIKIELLSWKEILQLIHSGAIRDAKTIATCLYYNSFMLNHKDFGVR